MFYSKSTGGFYSREIHGDNMPADAVDTNNTQVAMTARVLVRGAAQGPVTYSGIYWIDAEL